MALVKQAPDTPSVLYINDKLEFAELTFTVLAKCKALESFIYRNLSRKQAIEHRDSLIFSKDHIIARVFLDLGEVPAYY